MSIKTTLGIMALIILLASSWSWFDLPDEETLKASLAGLITAYGFWFVVGSSFLEALFLLGIYFPGSLIIFLAVGLAPTLSTAVLMMVAVSIGMLFGYLVDYALGYFGWYRLFLKFGLEKKLQQAKDNIEHNDLRYVAYTFWNPGLASFTATAAGSTRMPLARFFIVTSIGIIVWNTLWGILVYSLGANASNLISTKTVLMALALLVVYKTLRLIQAHYSQSKVDLDVM
jgi:membrane protein DedA with SNARE-associated domain